MNERLASAREQIDAVDREVLAALNRRLDLVRSLHAYKQETGLPLIDPGREESMLTLLQTANDGSISDEGIADLLRFLLDLTRKEIHGR